jgi:surfactin synthase thioesterase subunit
MIHYAGGNRYSFNFLMPYLKGLDVVSLELPGRGKRMDETLLMDLGLAADDLFDQIMKYPISDDFMIYGHSLGAYLGLKVAGMLERNGRFARQLVVSGNAGPGVREKKMLHQLDDEDFVEELKKLGGMPDGVLRDPELMNIFLPILKKDFTLVEAGDIDSIPPVTAPIYAMMGSEEETVAHISNWRHYTSGSFSFRVFPGNHFFIHHFPEQLAAIIKNAHGQNIILGR